MPPEVEATLTRAYEAVGRVRGTLVLEVSDLRHAGTKLGLGSSAAAASAAAAAVFATHEYDLGDPRVLDRVFDCAFDGHRSIAPQGSGVDVAASTYGGFLRFARSEDGLDRRPIDAPSTLAMRLVWTGQAARTSDLLRKISAHRAGEPDLHARLMERLRDVANEFLDAFERGDADRVVALAGEYGEAMKALGDAAGAPIVEARLERVAALAARFSGSAKPCGAGGGDVGIAFFGDSGAADDFERACSEEGLHPIAVSWGAQGARAL
jgi:phosphomevalonate kinase